MDLAVDYESGTYEGRLAVRPGDAGWRDSSAVFFRLFANDPWIYGGASIHVESVTVQTQSVAYELFVEDTVLMVPLPQPLPEQAPSQIEIQFTGRASVANPDNPDRMGYGILTRSAHAMTLTAFYPIVAAFSQAGWSLDPSTGFGDALMGEASDYNVTITVSRVPTLVATGESIHVRELGTKRIYEWEARSVRDFSIVLFDGYERLESEAGNVIVHAWFPPQHAAAAARASELAAAAVTWLGTTIGPSAFTRIDLVEVPLHQAAGVEFSGLVLISADYSWYPRDLFFAVIVAHEIAHQWFYAAVGNDVSEHPWLDESLATFLSYEILADILGPTSGQTLFNQAASVYASARRGHPQLSVTSPRYAFPDGTTYSSFVYSGGAILLDELRQRMGDDLFFQALRSYYETYATQIATSDDLLRQLRAACACSFEEILRAHGISP